MDQVINAARSLGKIIQEDSRYIRFTVAQQNNDRDAELQKMIGEFQEIRTELSQEMSKETKDQELINSLNAKMRSAYGKIFSNDNMRELTDSRNEVESLIKFVNQIITGATNGQDPDTIEFQESCGGSCSSCSGCG